MHYCDCKGTTKLQLLQRVFQRMLTDKPYSSCLSKIIIPAIFRTDYISALRQLTRNNNKTHQCHPTYEPVQLRTPEQGL